MIARAGKPLVKVTMIQSKAPRRLGFLAGQAEIHRNFLLVAQALAEGMLLLTSDARVARYPGPIRAV